MKSLINFSITSISLFITLCSTAMASTVYTTDGLNTHTRVGITSNLYTLNTDTGQVNLVGAVGHKINSLTWDATKNALYGTTSKLDTHNGLIKINTSTGAGTPVNLVSGWGVAGGRSITNITTNSAGEMYGVESNSRHQSGGLNLDQLVKIDTSTGIATNIGTLGAGQGFAWGSSLAFDSSETLRLKRSNVISPFLPEGREIHTIDELTGNATHISSLNIDNLETTEYIDLVTKNSSHGTIDKETDLFWLLTRQSSPSFPPTALHKVNFNTGEIVDKIELDFSLTGPLSSHLATLAIQPVPIPAAVWLLGSGLIALVGFSKRQQA